MWEVWKDYQAWDRAIATLRCGSDADQLPIYLTLEDETLDAIRKQIPGAPTLVEAVKKTLILPPTQGKALDLHIRALDGWRLGNRTDAPPCVALLTFFSVVARSMVADSTFSSSNYYGRLCDTLRIRDQTAIGRMRTGFADQSHRLWEALNGWLAEQGGRRGLPTAFAYNNLVHVGVPMSQALLRESDRKQLRDLFRYFDLGPGQRISTPDMAALLADWMSSGVSGHLKQVWTKQPDVRTQIAEVACRELEAWNGEVGIVGDDGRSLALLLVGLWRDFPAPRLALSLRVKAGVQLPETPYQLAPNPTLQATNAFRDVGRIELERTDSVRWFSIAGDHLISLPDAMHGNVRLQNEDRPNVSICRLARRVVPLRLDEELGLYVEVSQVEVGAKHIILVQELLADKVSSVLLTLASPGWTRFDGPRLRGLPQRWVAFHDVTVVDHLDASKLTQGERDDLGPLVAMGTTQLSLGAGMWLARGTWLAGHPPHVLGVGPHGKQFSAVLDILESGGALIPEQPLGQFQASGKFETDPGLVVGDYRVRLCEKGQTVASATFRLRTADTPRPLPLAEWVGHEDCSTLPGSALSASQLAPGLSPARWIRGAVLQGFGGLRPVAIVGLLPATPGILDAVEREDEESVPIVAARGVGASCILGSHYHEFRVPLGGLHLNPRVGTCKNCGTQREFRKPRWNASTT